MDIDVKPRIKSRSQQVLLEAAEAPFASITDPSFHLAKPFANVDDCPTLLVNFSKRLRDGDVVPGYRVLEFGAGSCRAGRMLNPLGMAVTSLEVSASALALGERLKRENNADRSQHKVLGVQRIDEQGDALKQDHFRHRFLDADLPPGATTTTFDLPVPTGAAQPVLEIDLVAEGVCCFVQNGSRTERVRP